MSQTVIDFSQDWATWIAGDGEYLGEYNIVGGSNNPPEHEWGNLANSLFTVLYPLGRGAALSVKGRTSNSAGAVADITAGTLGHVLRRDATPALTFGTLLAGSFATGPGIVTPAMLDNGGARSVLGRSANSSGARADISGSGTASAPQVLADDGTTASFTSFNTVRSAASLIYEVNYSTLANNTLVDGAETIDGLSYVAANMAELGTAAVQNGTGIRMVAATSNGGALGFDGASQTAAYIYVPLSQIASYDGTGSEWMVEIYMPSIVLETNGENIILGLWGVAGSPWAASAARFRVAKIVNSAGTRVARIIQSSTALDADANLATHNVLALKWTATGMCQVFTGIWSSGWPATYTVGPTCPTTMVGQSPMNSPDVRIVMGLATANDASPTTAITIERMRIRRIS